MTAAGPKLLGEVGFGTVVCFAPSSHCKALEEGAQKIMGYYFLLYMTYFGNN